MLNMESPPCAMGLNLPAFQYLSSAHQIIKVTPQDRNSDRHSTVAICSCNAFITLALGCCAGKDTQRALQNIIGLIDPNDP